MGQYYRIQLKSAKFGIFSQIKVQSNPLSSWNSEKHPISGPKWPKYMVKIMKLVKNGENSHIWSLNRPRVGRRRGTRIPKHIWTASKIPLLWRYRGGFRGVLSVCCQISVFGSKKVDFWWFLAFFGHFWVWINAGWCITVFLTFPVYNGPKI